MCTQMPYNSNSSTTSLSTSCSSSSNSSTSSPSMMSDGQSASNSNEEMSSSSDLMTTMMMMIPSTSSAIQLETVGAQSPPPPSSARRKRNGAVSVARAATAIQIFGNDASAALPSSGTAAVVATASASTIATRKKSASQPPPIIYDVFLGGSCGSTVWRQDLVIPYLKKRSITYYDPQRPAWSENMIYEEAVAKENSRLFLFVLDPGNINATSFLEIAYLSARKAPKLVVVFLGRREWSGKAHPMDLPDRIRTCDLLEAILKRHSVPMLNSISEALDCVDEMIIGEQSWRSAMANPLQRLPFVRVRAARLARRTRHVCTKALRPRTAAVCVARRVGVLLAVEAAVCLLLITFVFYKAPAWTIVLPFIAFDYLSVILALIYCRFRSRQRKSGKPAYLLLAGGGAPLPRLNDAAGRRRGCFGSGDDYNAAATARAAAATPLLLQNAGKSASLSMPSTATTFIAAATSPTAAKPWNQVQRPYAPPSPLPYSATFPSDAALRLPPSPYAATDVADASLVNDAEQEVLLLNETTAMLPVALTATPSPLRRRRSGPSSATSTSALFNSGSSSEVTSPSTSPPPVLATRRQTYVEEPEVGTFAALAECLRRQDEEAEARRGCGAKEAKRKISSPSGADFGKQLASDVTMVDTAVRRHDATLMPPQIMAAAQPLRKNFERAPTATALLSAGSVAAAPSTSVVGYDVFLSCSSSSELDWITQQAVPQLHKSGLSYTSALMYDKDVRIPMLHTASHILYYIPSYKTFLSGMIEIAYFIGHWDWQVTVCVPREAECLMLPDDKDEAMAASDQQHNHRDKKRHDAETVRAVERRNECYRMAFCYLKDMAQRRQCRIFTRVEDAVQHIANDKHREGGGGRHASTAAQRRKGGARLRQIVEKQHLFKEGSRADNASSIDALAAPTAAVTAVDAGAESGSSSSGTVTDYLAFLSSSLGVSGHEKSAEVLMP